MTKEEEQKFKEISERVALKLFTYLAAFNRLDQLVINAVDRSFEKEGIEIDCYRICYDNGITYRVR